MLEIKLSGIECDSGAFIIADSSLIGGGRPIGPYTPVKIPIGRYHVGYTLSNGDDGEGNLIVRTGDVWAVDPTFLPNLKGKQLEWAMRDHLYGKFPTNGTITVHNSKGIDRVGITMYLTRKTVKVE